MYLRSMSFALHLVEYEQDLYDITYISWSLSQIFFKPNQHTVCNKPVKASILSLIVQKV